MQAAIVKIFGIIMFTTVFLTGCGQKGDLYQAIDQTPERVTTK